MNERQKLEVRGELFALCSTPGVNDKKRARAIIGKLAAEERMAVRAGIEALSYLLDDVFLEEQREKRSRVREV